ncbi:hypothetical protein A2U01_0110821, partial [Trifolium medium]|nr:hypothetical protein [Trifolium medium]
VALRAAQVTPARCAATRNKTSKTEKHGALRYTAGRVAPETELAGNAENANLKGTKLDNTKRLD